MIFYKIEMKIKKSLFSYKENNDFFGMKEERDSGLEIFIDAHGFRSTYY